MLPEKVTTFFEVRHILFNIVKTFIEMLRFLLRFERSIEMEIKEEAEAAV